MKIEALIDEKHGNRIRIKFSELTEKDFMFGKNWKNFEGRERKNQYGDIVNNKGTHHFTLKVSDEQFMEDPLFEELVRRNFGTYELKPNPEYDQNETAHTIPIKFVYHHDPENPWKDPKVSVFNGRKLDDYEERDLMDLDRCRIIGGVVECHTFDGRKSCTLYLDNAVFEIEEMKREDIRDKYRARLAQHDESEDEPIPFN